MNILYCHPGARLLVGITVFLRAQLLKNVIEIV
jgi:hypothetical protein